MQPMQPLIGFVPIQKISVSILLQSESQLRAMYGPEDAETIINNCDRYIYMGGMDLTTCRISGLRASIDSFRGAKVSLAQCPELLALCGVRVTG